MSVDAKTVARIAHLARIRVEAEALEPLAGELNKILGFVEQLGEVNTDGIAPMASVSGHALPWREDKVTDGDKPDAVLANAPRAEYGFFAVPKVIE